MCCSGRPDETIAPTENIPLLIEEPQDVWEA